MELQGKIIIDPSNDDVSTLGGSVLAGLQLDGTPNRRHNSNNTVKDEEDEPTASVNLDYDYNRNQYRSDIEDRSRTVYTETTGSGGPTTITNFTKLGMNGESIYADDDMSFEQLYADMDHDDMIPSSSHHHTSTMMHPQSHMANRVKPFEVRAPPGKLGMVVDTPNGNVPVVRAIKPDSVLIGSVQIGDRLISVDHTDVTNMSALDVSSLISLKQHQTRTLIFCRVAPSSPQQTTSPQKSSSNIPSPMATTTATSAAS